MKKDLTRGSITAALCSFAAPMILGNLLQQAYNLGDTLVIGRCLGDNALAAVGSTYTLTTFIYSIIIGLCMGAGSLISYYGGKKDPRKLADVMSLSLLMIGATAVIIELAALAFRPQILRLLKTPAEIMSLTSDYVRIILIGICFIFLYNYYSFMLRGLGDSVTPLVFLGISSAVNILLDILFVAKFSMGIKGAAWATLISQALAFRRGHAYVFRRLRAAVGHEFRHFDDIGAGQQFRHARYFGIRHLARRRRCRHMVVYPDRLVFGRYCRCGDNAAQSENHRRYIITQKSADAQKKCLRIFLFEIVTFVTIFCPARPPAYCMG